MIFSGIIAFASFVVALFAWAIASQHPEPWQTNTVETVLVAGGVCVLSTAAFLIQLIVWGLS